jgi:Coenzyme PQQ synthesis protein D (PqqD)
MSSESYVRSDSVVSRVIAGETLVVPIRGSVGDLASIYSLNAVGSTIWQALEKPKAVEELAQVVEEEYEVRSDQAQQDVLKFLEEMRSNSLVVPISSKSTNSPRTV